MLSLAVHQLGAGASSPFLPPSQDPVSDVEIRCSALTAESLARELDPPGCALAGRVCPPVTSRSRLHNGVDQGQAFGGKHAYPRFSWENCCSMPFMPSQG